MVNHMYHLL